MHLKLISFKPCYKIWCIYNTLNLEETKSAFREWAKHYGFGKGLFLFTFALQRFAYCCLNSVKCLHSLTNHENTTCHQRKVRVHNDTTHLECMFCLTVRCSDNPSLSYDISNYLTINWWRKQNAKSHIGTFLLGRTTV